MIRAYAFAAVVIATALLLLSPLSSCTQANDDKGSDTEHVTQLTPPRKAVSETCMLALHNAKNFHHIADVYLKEGKADEATKAVRNILSIKFSAECDKDVVLDARARLAKLLSAQGKTDEAMSVVTDGLESAKTDSFFLANLHTVKGEVHEAIAVTIEAKDPEKAKSQRREAIKAYSKSIEINERLQKKLMGESK